MLTPLISIVIPARNEEDNICNTVSDLEIVLKDLPHETLIINDHSDDTTGAKISELSISHPSVKLIHNTTTPGFASTLQVGFKAASGNAVVVVMADASDDPHTILNMAAQFTRGYDLVCGSRYIAGGGKQGGPKTQRFFSFWVNKFFCTILRFPTADASNAFKLYRRETLQNITINETGFAVSLELTIKFWEKNCRIIDVPTIWKGRVTGKSKFKLCRAFRSYSYLVGIAVAQKFKSIVFKNKK